MSAEEVKVVEEVDLDSLPPKKRKKHVYRLRLLKLFEEYHSVLIIGVDNVRSNQMQGVRTALRGKAVLLMGKNTLMRVVVRQAGKNNPKLLALLPLLRGNVGMVFTNDKLTAVRDVIVSNTIPAAAKSGAIAPCDVFVPPGPTGMDPGQTQFFSSMGIATKINRGSIEIIETKHVISAGEKVSSSAVALLAKLNIKPFTYGMVALSCYDKGSVYDAAVLDLDSNVVTQKFMNAVKRIAAIGMEVGYPTTASVPFMVRHSLKKAMALGMESGYRFGILDEMFPAKK